jgi:hypothetical protein
MVVGYGGDLHQEQETYHAFVSGRGLSAECFFARDRFEVHLGQVLIEQSYNNMRSFLNSGFWDVCCLSDNCLLRCFD